MSVSSCVSSGEPTTEKKSPALGGSFPAYAQEYKEEWSKKKRIQVEKFVTFSRLLEATTYISRLLYIKYRGRPAHEQSASNKKV